MRYLMGKNGPATAHKPIKLEYEFATLSGPCRPAPASNHTEGLR